MSQTRVVFLRPGGEPLGLRERSISEGEALFITSRGFSCYVESGCPQVLVAGYLCG